MISFARFFSGIVLCKFCLLSILLSFKRLKVVVVLAAVNPTARTLPTKQFSILVWWCDTLRRSQNELQIADTKMASLLNIKDQRPHSLPPWLWLSNKVCRSNSLSRKNRDWATRQSVCHCAFTLERVGSK